MILEYPGPGPQERKWMSRLSFKLLGRWPRGVVAERLAISDALMIEARVAALRREFAQTEGGQDADH